MRRRRVTSAALGTLLEAHRARLYAAALAILGDRAQAQDAVQDAFLVALRRFGELREPAAVGAWLHTIVRNECRMRLRACREVPGEVSGRCRARRCEVDEALERLALRDWLWTALEALPDDLRATVMLRYFTRHAAYTEIAAILGIPVGTVRSRLNQAKRRLADALLATAAAAHHDQAALVAERGAGGGPSSTQVEREGTRGPLRRGCRSGRARRGAVAGIPRWSGWRIMRGAWWRRIAAGVRVHLTDIVASDGVTIVEARLREPGRRSHHCPATHTEVRFHPQGRATRIILYYPEVGDQASTEAASR